MRFIFYLSAIIFLGQASLAKDIRLLNPNFFKKDEVCANARATDPSKKAALVLLKTHLCDAGTGVCMDSLRTFADDANVFVHDNFVPYQTRFIGYDLDDKHHVNEEHFAGEQQIRDEWSKHDSNPEVLVLNLSNCQVMGRRYLMDVGFFNSPLFTTRYFVMRQAVLSIPGVPELLGGNIATTDALNLELAKIQMIRAAGKLEKTRHEAFASLVENSNSSNLSVASSETQLTGVTSVRLLEDVLRLKTGKDYELFITESGKVAR